MRFRAEALRKIESARISPKELEEVAFTKRGRQEAGFEKKGPNLAL
jgi:hypothetical protein